MLFAIFNRDFLLSLIVYLNRHVANYHLMINPYLSGCRYTRDKISLSATMSYLIIVVGATQFSLSIDISELDRRRLRSSSSDDVVIPTTRLVTVGDRAFTAAGSRLWNSLPPDIRSAQTLPVFCNRLKTYLFSKRFPHNCIPMLLL